MAKTISVSDDVYEWMKQKKEDKSFSEFIRSHMKQGDLKELEGIGFSEDWEETREELDEASDRTTKRLESY